MISQDTPAPEPTLPGPANHPGDEATVSVSPLLRRGQSLLHWSGYILGTQFALGLVLCFVHLPSAGGDKVIGGFLFAEAVADAIATPFLVVVAIIVLSILGRKQVGLGLLLLLCGILAGCMVTMNAGCGLMHMDICP
jgi:hypothetical protein